MPSKKKANHVVLLHGFASGADKHWFPWMHAELEKLGVRVNAPTMPSPIKPIYKDWVRAGVAVARMWTPDTVVVAHSVGGPFALRLLQDAARSKVRAVILVSPLYSSLVSLPQLLKLLGQPVDWRALRSSAGSFEVIHAKNDPLVPFDHGLRYAESLNATLHLFEKGGHFNGRTFPFLLEVIKKYI